MKKAIISTAIISALLSTSVFADDTTNTPAPEFDFSDWMLVNQSDLNAAIAPLQEFIEANSIAIDNLSITVEANSITASQNQDAISQNSADIAAIKQGTVGFQTINASEYFATGKTTLVYSQKRLNDTLPHFSDMVIERVEESDDIGPTVTLNYSVDWLNAPGDIIAPITGSNTFRISNGNLNLISHKSSFNNGPITTNTYSPEIVRLKNGSAIGIYTGGSTIQTSTSDLEDSTPSASSFVYKVLHLGTVDVTVPAGTFEDCILSEYTNDPSTRKTWTCKGIGRVKWEDDNGTWELVSYE